MKTKECKGKKREKQKNKASKQTSKKERELTSIAKLHDEIDMVDSFFAVPQSDDIFMMQLRNFFQNLYFFPQQVLGLGQILLRDQFYCHYVVGVLWGNKGT